MYAVHCIFGDHNEQTYILLTNILILNTVQMLNKNVSGPEWIMLSVSGRIL